MDLSKSFKENLKTIKEDFEVNSSPSFSLFEDFSKQMGAELDSNSILKFKKQLKDDITSIKEENKNYFKSFCDNIPETQEQREIKEEIIETLNILEDKIDTPKDLIFDAVQAITKENHQKESYVNLLSEPDVKKPDPEIKSLQNKLKLLEEWVSKISMTGPGSGEVNFRWLDDVDRDTIGNTDQILRYNPETSKFFFGQLSGDQGPINSIAFDQTGAEVSTLPGMLQWNPEKDCLNIHQADDTTLQVGLENYIRVHNITENTLQNGTLVQFSGVNVDGGEIPTCVPFIANSSAVPLYMIGLLTNHIHPGESGRATVLGEVRDIDTTGTDVSEVWEVGDLLWASPTNPGKLTKVRPTAPNVVISVAAVIKKDAINGVLLVRPTIFPRLYYGSFYDTTNQTAVAANTPYAVKFNNTKISSGFHVENNTKIVAENAGLYNFQFSLQVGSTNSSSANIFIWYRKNGINSPYSSTKITINSNSETKAPAWDFTESLEIGEWFELMWAVDSTSVSLKAVASTAFCPAVPSSILTVSQINL